MAWLYRLRICFIFVVLLLSVLFSLYLPYDQAGRDYRNISEPLAHDGQENPGDAQFLCRMMGLFTALPEFVLQEAKKVLSVSCLPVHGEQPQYVRAIIRPSAGNPLTHLPSCLTRLGATSGFHFFYEGKSGKRFTVPASNLASLEFLPSGCSPKTPEVEANSACHLEKLAEVKDFPLATHEFKSKQEGQALRSLFREMECRFDEHTLEQLLLIGRADVRNILPQDKRKLYGSNNGLAQARAKWVKTQLSQRFPGKIDPGRIVLLSAGPLYISGEAQGGQNEENERHASNRVVEVYTCWEPKPERADRSN